MMRSSVVICGVARDCASQLANLIPKLEHLGAHFKTYKIIVVENDSQDSTAIKIASWAAQNNNVVPIVFSRTKLSPNEQDGISAPPGNFDRSRISGIAFARNVYLQELQQHQQADFVIVVDLDIKEFSIPGIATSFDQRSEWDCATSSGLRYTLRNPFKSTVYWDTYAYEPIEGFVGGVQRLVDIRSNQEYLRERLKSEALLPALSAFGGLAIYRYQMLVGQQYESLDNNDSEVPVLCEHVALHRSISRSYERFRLVINPLQKLRYEPLGTTLKRNFLSLFTR